MIHSIGAGIDIPGPLPWLYFDMREGGKINGIFFCCCHGLKFLEAIWLKLKLVVPRPIEPDLK